jgi:hypothetical protein
MYAFERKEDAERKAASAKREREREEEKRGERKRKEEEKAESAYQKSQTPLSEERPAWGSA